MHLSHLLKEPLFCFLEVLKHCEAENINFVEYFAIDQYFLNKSSLKLSLKVSSDKFLNSRDLLYIAMSSLPLRIPITANQKM